MPAPLMTRVTNFAKENRHANWDGLVTPGLYDTELHSHLTDEFLRNVLVSTSQLELCRYLRAHVWNDAYRTQFWVVNALERFIVRLLTTRVDVHGIRILQRSLDEGAPVDILACGVHSCLPKHISTLTAEELLASCHLLKSIVCDEEARDCVLDARLFRDLSIRGAESDVLVSAVLDVFLCGNVTTFAHAFLMAENAAHRLIADFTNVPRLGEAAHEGHYPHLSRSLAFLEALATSMEWHPHMSEWVVALARYGWPPMFGTLVAKMLTTPSVHFVVAMERQKRLASLIRMSHRHASEGPGAESWRVVRGRLRIVWPSRFAAVLNLPDVCKTCATTAYECPITLQACVYPTVASDGHTYERDALLRLMVENLRPVSPVTKAPLLFLVFDNYALHS